MARKLFGSRLTDQRFEDLWNTTVEYNINTRTRLLHFLSQIGHESLGLYYTKELASGEDYEWRKDLGNVEEGDGVKFKGAGFIQLTGRSNYESFANDMNDREIVNQGCAYVAEHYPFRSAGFWWHKNKMNDLCDRGDTTVKVVTRRVNGGYNGLEGREAWYAKAVDAFQEVHEK